MRPLAACSALMLCSIMAACDSAPCYVSTDRFALTSPTDASELLPGEPVTWEWSPDSIDEEVDMGFSLKGSDFQSVGVGSAMLHEGSITVLREDLTRIPPDVYEIEVSFVRCDQPLGVLYRPGSRLRVLAQGITFDDATGLIIVSDEVPRDVNVRAVSLSTMDVELYVDPSTTTDGDELRFARSTVQGDRFARSLSYQFTGMTTEGAPIPGGDYHLLARVYARDGIVYDIPGPWLRWVILP